MFPITDKSQKSVDMFLTNRHVETACCLYHQKKDFISVTYEPKDADYLKQMKRNKSIQPKEVGAGKYSLEGRK